MTNDTPPDIAASKAFGEAQKFEMPFGKYKCKALDKIAETDDGLAYLDQVLGFKNLNPITRQHVTVYLAWPSIARELEQVLAEKS